MNAFASSLYVGRVTHRRLRPRRHALNYRTYAMLVDLDELPAIGRNLRLFSHNRFNIFSLCDRDYGAGESGPLRRQVEKLMGEAGLTPDGGPIRLLTMPRVLGYAFNPLSLYFCHARDGALKAILYEVNNTFGQRHSYFLPVEGDDAGLIRQRFAKEFHVSPFLAMDMAYEFAIAPPGEKVSIAVIERDRDGVILTATQKQSRLQLSDGALARLFFSHPLLTLKVIAGIHFEAARLWVKGVGVEKRSATAPSRAPIASGSNEASAPSPSIVERAAKDSARRSRLAEFVLRRMISLVERGRLVVRLPSGAAIEHIGPLPGPTADLRLNSWRALRRLAIEGGVGFALSYVDGDWTSGDLTALLELAVVNGRRFRDAIGGASPSRALNWLAHRLRTNTPARSRRNIEYHYDLGNDFFRLWLDARMIYSSAIYDDPGATLEEGQQTKLACIIDCLGVETDANVLELGCGWGALAAEMARRGARVIGVTLSPSQRAHCQALARAEGLENRLDFRLLDYREIDGRYDRIVAIEMIEAVGREYLPKFFELIRDRLAPGGRCVLQAITIVEERFPDYCRRPDFIQRCIFPGGFLPTKTLLRETLERAGLRLVSSERFARSYALTLREWRRRFVAAWPEIERLGFPPSFKRKWEYYLCYCEAGFRAGAIDVGLYCLTHARAP